MFAELEVAQCTGWMHCFVGCCWVAATFTLPFRQRERCPTKLLLSFAAPLKGKWCKLCCGERLEPKRRCGVSFRRTHVIPPLMFTALSSP